MKNIHILATDKPSRYWMTKLGNLTRCHDIRPIKEALGNNVNIYITNSEEIKDGDYWIYICPINGLDYGDNNNPIVKNNLPPTWFEKLHDKVNYKKIILTDNQDLIKDGVQAIDNEFLEWFVKNPSCEFVEVNEKLIIIQDKPLVQHQGNKPIVVPHRINYKIIPKEEPTDFSGIVSQEFFKLMDLKEEPKQDEIMERFIANAKQQETLEEAAERIFKIYSNNTSLAESHYDYMMDKEDFKEASLEIAKWQQERSYSEEEVLELLKKFAPHIRYNHKELPHTWEQVVKEWFEQNKKKQNERNT